MNWTDISVPLRTGMIHWPGDPEPILERIHDIDRGDAVNITFVRMSAHTGTHMDAPLHYLAGGPGMDAFSFEAGIGPARVLDVSASPEIGAEAFAPHHIQPGERILLRTQNSATAWENLDFNPDLAHVTPDGARYLAARGIALIGVDSLSVGACSPDGDETHRILLGAGIWILEGLNLLEIAPGEYDLVALPLRVAGGDGAPVRAVVRPRQSL